MSEVDDLTLPPHVAHRRGADIPCLDTSGREIYRTTVQPVSYNRTSKGTKLSRRL